MSETEELLERLELTPGDWAARLALIEIAVRKGDTAFAKRLVRASPSDQPTPPEVQIRIHTLLTKGIEAQASIPPEPVTSPTPTPTPTPVPAEEPQPAKVPEAKPESTPPRSSLEGGLSALIESDLPAEPRRASSGKSAKARPAPHPDLAAVKAKWESYDGSLELVALEPNDFVEAPSTAPERFSAVSMAIMLHVVVAILVGLVVVQTPLPKPPQLVVSVIHEREADLTTTRITKPNVEIKPSAAAAQSVDVISSVGTSSFSVPDVETSDDLIVSSMLPGVAPLGNGMSFSTKSVDASDVNFFGLSGSGKRIVFVIDATAEMLVDEKGGMAAYDKVKTEVGVMLTTLNRGTEFNLLLYHGKQLVAFRDTPVPGLPSNIRLAIEWLDPLNRRYESLGLGNDFGPTHAVSGVEGYPIAAGDLAHYSKAIQKAMEWQAGAIFCVVSGYRGMGRAPTPEMTAKPASAAPAATVDPREQKAWQDAVAKTRAWLEKENAARREKELSPKVVVNFNQLVREITGATPPARRNAPASRPGMPPVTPEEIELQIAKLVKDRYKADGVEEPSVHMVLFLGEAEEIGTDEDHFKNLTRKNRGKLKILRGLAALQNVTGAE
jgi:hypothetical protein